MFTTITSRRTALAATVLATLLTSAAAQAVPIQSNRGNAPGQQGGPNVQQGRPNNGQPNNDNGGGAGNLCDPGQGQSFQDCTWNGSPTIMKFNFGGSWAVNPDEAGPGWDLDPNDGPTLTDIDNDPDTITYSLNGFTVTFSNTADAPKHVSWTYDNSGSLVTYWHVKYGGQDQWVVQGNGQPVSSGTWLNDGGIGQSISHITFFDSGQAQIPEPALLALLGLGLAGLVAVRGRKSA